MAGSAQVLLLVRARIGRQTVHRSDEISDAVECRGLSRGRSGTEPQALANNVGLGDLAFARFRRDVGDKWLRQAYGKDLHRTNTVLH
jgi:hypothetical protein